MSSVGVVPAVGEPLGGCGVVDFLSSISVCADLMVEAWGNAGIAISLLIRPWKR